MAFCHVRSTYCMCFILFSAENFLVTTPAPHCEAMYVCIQSLPLWPNALDCGVNNGCYRKMPRTLSTSAIKIVVLSVCALQHCTGHAEFFCCICFKFCHCLMLAEYNYLSSQFRLEVTQLFSYFNFFRLQEASYIMQGILTQFVYPPPQTKKNSGGGGGQRMSLQGIKCWKWDSFMHIVHIFLLSIVQF